MTIEQDLCKALGDRYAGQRNDATICNGFLRLSEQAIKEKNYTSAQHYFARASSECVTPDAAVAARMYDVHRQLMAGLLRR